jgi:hypothetical protein
MWLPGPGVAKGSNVKQEASWVFSILETALKVSFALLYFVLHRKASEVDAKLRLADSVGGEITGLLQSAAF